MSEDPAGALPEPSPPPSPQSAAEVASPAHPGASSFLRRWVVEPLSNPTGKQKEAYARFFHTVSAACFIGAVTVEFGGTVVAAEVKTGVLILLGIVLFFVAASFAKGDQ